MTLKDLFLMFDLTRYIPKRKKRYQLQNVEEAIEKFPYCHYCGKEMFEKAIIVRTTDFNRRTGIRIEYHQKIWVCRKNWDHGGRDMYSQVGRLMITSNLALRLR